MKRSLFVVILIVGALLAGLVEWNSRIGLHSEMAAYRIESSEVTDQSVEQIEVTFNHIYRALRTVARLPGVRAIDWSQSSAMDHGGEALNGDARLTIQELYNALAMDVAVSELYIVPLNLDPDGRDPSHLSPLEPITTFDEFIVGRSVASAKGALDPSPKEPIEEIEIYEYRLMRSQLDWMIAHVPNDGFIDALDYPVVGGPEVITCDNSHYDVSAPNEHDRSGIVLSVPIFDTDGVLRGCVSGVMLTHSLSDLLTTGDSAILNAAHDYVVEPHISGQWAVSHGEGAEIGAEPDELLLYSEIRSIHTADRSGDWVFWTAHPDTMFWSRTGVKATLQARTFGFASVIILTLGALVGTMLILRAYASLTAVNTGLEQVVFDRTAEIRSEHDAALQAFLSEKLALDEKERAMAQLEIIASTDKLTGLPNRAVLLDRLDQMMKQSSRDRCRFAVLFFDFDRFKVVNDSLGHEVGDALLCSIADIFRGELRDTDTAARFGGDEFVVLLGNLADWADAHAKAEKLEEAFSLPHQLGDRLIVSTASIGLVTNEHSYETSDEMIRDADAAMYQAKENGKAQVVVFDRKMHADAMERLTLEEDLRLALAEEQFRLVYQPIVELDSGKIKGFEALIRWDHPQRGEISPAQFISIAEDTGLIKDIGMWTLRQASMQNAEWNRRMCSEQMLTINVNVSKRQLLDPSFVDMALACRSDCQSRAGEVQLEITESTIADDRSDVIPLLHKLRENGFSIAMDDFGTGLSSLSTLHAYPIDVLKIDQAFVRVLDRDRSLFAVVTSIVNLAENLGIHTVAEGVESTDIVGALQSIGCTWGQGYFFAKPLSVEGAEAYLKGQQNHHSIAA